MLNQSAALGTILGMVIGYAVRVVIEHLRRPRESRVLVDQIRDATLCECGHAAEEHVMRDNRALLASDRLGACKAVERGVLCDCETFVGRRLA